MSGHNKLLKTMLSSLVLILLAVAIMVSPSLVGQVVATAEVGINSDSVYIPDPNLEAAIRDELNKSAGDITVTDMESLLYLYASYRDIKMLTGLEYAVNLEGLYLDYNQLTDISALSGLVNLRFLDLAGNQLTNISALSGLVNLRSLYLDYNQLTNISALSGLVNLRSLYLYGNQLTDISALSGLVNLGDLSLSNNQCLL